MALCLAESLDEKAFDPTDQMQRYLRWYRTGYLSAPGRCFDIGNTIRDALLRFERTGNPFAGSTHPRAAGNGSIMRMAPVPLYFADNPRKAIEKSGESSRTTHGATVAVDACRYMGALIVGTLQGGGKDELLSDHYCPVSGYWEQFPLDPVIAEIAAGSFKLKNHPEIKGSGYAAHSLEAALWAFYRSKSFREGSLVAVNLGDDADTTGAVFGQIAGAHYGIGGIQSEWRGKIVRRELIEELAGRLIPASA